MDRCKIFLRRRWNRLEVLKMQPDKDKRKMRYQIWVRFLCTLCSWSMHQLGIRSHVCRASETTSGDPQHQTKHTPEASP